MNDFAELENISFLNSNAATHEEFNLLFKEGLFNDEKKWDDFKLSKEIKGLMDSINSRKKYYMSKLSLGVYNVLENGPGPEIKKNEEIYLFSGFTEIETISKIGKMFVQDNYSINPAVFPNSVHHISLCYYTILKNISNYCATITDGLTTNLSFINFIKNRIKIAENFIVISGDEDSEFFQNEISTPLEIYPTYVSYKVIPKKQSGFKYIDKFNSIDKIKELDIFENAKNIFCDKKTFFKLKNIKDKNIYSEYPIVKDQPCGIAFRIALPFYFNIKGKSLVIDESKESYNLFEVNI